MTTLKFILGVLLVGYVPCLCAWCHLDKNQNTPLTTMFTGALFLDVVFLLIPAFGIKMLL